MTSGARSAAPSRRRDRRLLIAAAVALPVAVAACAVVGLPPLLPAFLAAFGFLAVRPVPGLAYVFVVLNAPLGLRFAGVEGLVGDAFGGREYALGLSAAAVTGVHALRAAVRGRWSNEQLIAGVVVLVVLGVWSLIGVAHHGPAQTVAGLRLTVMPLFLLLVMTALPRPDVVRMVTVAAWLMIANAAATVAELIIGPAQLVAWGFEEGRNVRYIGDTFRAPGLTEFNAELGILAGAYLLGYVTLWLAPGGRPTRWSWHLGAVCAVVCLALSTSRSGALLVVAGVVAAAVANRSGSAAARRRARLVGLGVIVCVLAGFVVVGATGARSLFQRFEIWSDLLGGDLPLWGRGIGAAGAATVSRVAGGEQIFVDNYFVSVALQYGLPMMVVLLAAVGYLFFWLWRRGATRPSAVLHVAVLAGLSAACLVVEAWEYLGAMMGLAIFVAHGRFLDADKEPQSRSEPGVVGQIDAETVVLQTRQSPTDAPTVVMPRVPPSRPAAAQPSWPGSPPGSPVTPPPAPPAQPPGPARPYGPPAGPQRRPAQEPRWQGGEEATWSPPAEPGRSSPDRPRRRSAGEPSGHPVEQPQWQPVAESRRPPAEPPHRRSANRPYGPSPQEPYRPPVADPYPNPAEQPGRLSGTEAYGPAERHRRPPADPRWRRAEESHWPSSDAEPRRPRVEQPRRHRAIPPPLDDETDVLPPARPASGPPEHPGRR
ncbi:hypothetical protein [Micromonospora sp. NPDC048063]|uniref:hypothetical protein n=1 Tax=Micromonospora sp. NPDC048063 TaxID=3364256 RepID=UPI0037214608